ncbi:Dynamin central region-domain-containing protein [Panaeolus papilionaceus]|nr:Dynamin central region-domain-containing protein [Panaeolus papilionaceus]
MICEISSDAIHWSCTVSLDIAGSPNGPNEPANPHLRIKFDETTDKSQVELILRRAQAAILNYPERNYRDYMTKSRDELSLMPRQHEFSENKIVVQLRDPNATDVHFVDLPGLIQNADGQLIKLIERLTKREIAKSNTIIVIAMPMSDDYQLMQAVKLAQKADPSGQRTLGVLTKPDYLTTGATGMRNEWRLIIEGQKHKTAHGYFCVRLPDDEERKARKTPAEMEELARSFFESQTPWSEMQDEFGYRFGVKNLVKYISPILMNMIEKNLPLLLKEVDDELAKARFALAALPVLVGQDSPALEIVKRITAFCDEIKNEIFGSQTHRLTQQSRNTYNDFKANIQNTRPRFETQPWTSSLADPNPVTSSHNPVLTIADVRKEIEETTGWELPGHIPFEATENIILRHLRPWERITFDCFEEIFSILERFIDPLKDRHFKPYYFLLDHVRVQVKTLLAQSKDNCEKTLDKLLHLEQKPVYTWNTEILLEQENQWFDNLRDRNGSYNGRSSPTNREELMVMAKVYAYFQVSHRRFIDYAPLMMEHELKQYFVSTLNTKLLSSIFSPSTPSSKPLEKRLQDLLLEDPINANKRAQLTTKITTLSKIRSRITAFGVRQRSAFEDEEPVLHDSDLSDSGSVFEGGQRRAASLRSNQSFGNHGSRLGTPSPAPSLNLAMPSTIPNAPSIPLALGSSNDGSSWGLGQGWGSSFAPAADSVKKKKKKK